MNLEMSPLFVINKVETTIAGIDNEILASEILNNRTRISSNPDDSAFEDMVLDTAENTQGKKLIEKVSEIATSMGLELNTYWTHIHEPLESSNLHHHVDDRNSVLLSWVYYVKVPNKTPGNLVFVLDPKDNRAPTATVMPEEGKLLIFPSFLLRKVTKNLSDSVRISVAGDFIASKQGDK